jgi:hypothetical protein
MSKRPVKKKAGTPTAQKRKITLNSTQPDPANLEKAKAFSNQAAKNRSKVDIAHWYITVLDLNVNFDAPLTAVRQGTNINFGLAQECNQYQYFYNDRLNLQKSDVSTASTVGQFYQDILARYVKNGWTLT